MDNQTDTAVPAQAETGRTPRAPRATIGLLVPSAVTEADSGAAAGFTTKLSLGLAVLLILTYGLGMVFSLKTHRELFDTAGHDTDEGDEPWPIGVALVILAVVTVLVALVSEVFVESVQQAAEAFGMTPAFVGFIVVALVGAAAEMASAFAGARKNRLDLSVGIALGSASQIALFVAPVLVFIALLFGQQLTLVFNQFELAALLAAVVITALIALDGESNWLEGAQLLIVYVILAIAFFFLPNVTEGAHAMLLP